MPLYPAYRLPPSPDPSDHGLKCWNYDPMHADSSSVLVAGTLYVFLLYPRVTVSISTLWTAVFTGGATLTNVGFALYTQGGVLLTSSVNANGATAAAFQTVGLKTVTFSTPQTISAPFYAAYWTTGTTQPAFGRTSGTNAGANNVNLASPNMRNATANTGLTTAAPANLTAQTGDAPVRWIAAS